MQNLGANDGKPVVIRSRNANARRYIGKRLDGRAERHRYLRRDEMYETESGELFGRVF